MPKLPYIPDDQRPTWTGKYPPFDHHGIYPWSVLDTRTSEWRERRKHWEALMPDDGTAGRAAQLYAHGKSGYHTSINNGRSKFDLTLTDVMLQWYTAPNSRIYDPFAGGITRGFIATHLGHHYTGVDINPDQIAHNKIQVPQATWIHGDATTTQPHNMDMILTCPPYHNVEKYTDHPSDLSNMTWKQHLQAVTQTLHNCYEALNDHRYIVWVIGDLRDNKGHLRLLPHETAQIMQKTGFKLVNEHILINPVGTRHRMLRRWWSPTRSAGRLHQHVLVAVKGDRRKAANNARRQPHC